MTVETTATISGPYISDGEQIEWPFTFRVDDPAQVRIITESPTGVRTTIVPDAVMVSTPGGSASLEIEAGFKVWVARETPVTQTTSFQNQAQFFPEAHERAFDKLTMLAQELRYQAARQITGPIGEAIGELQSALARADKAFVWDGMGNPSIDIKPSVALEQALAAVFSEAEARAIGDANVVGVATDAAISATASLAGSYVYDSVAAVQAATIAAPVQRIFTRRYYEGYEGGGAAYDRVATEPAHAGKIQSAGGQWWELVVEGGRVHCACFGVIPVPQVRSETLAYFDALTVKPTYAGLAVIDRYIRDLIKSNWWNLLDATYLRGMHNYENGQPINILSPAGPRATVVGTMGAIKVRDGESVQTDGTYCWSTNIDLSAAGRRITLDNGFMFIFQPDEQDNAIEPANGWQIGNGGWGIMTKSTGNQLYVRSSSGDSNGFTAPDWGRGQTSVIRKSSAGYKIYKDFTEFRDFARTSSALGGVVHLHGRNGGASSTAPIAVAGFGAVDVGADQRARAQIEALVMFNRRLVRDLPSALKVGRVAERARLNVSPITPAERYTKMMGAIKFAAGRCTLDTSCPIGFVYEYNDELRVQHGSKWTGNSKEWCIHRIADSHTTDAHLNAVTTEGNYPYNSTTGRPVRENLGVSNVHLQDMHFDCNRTRFGYTMLETLGGGNTGGCGIGIAFGWDVTLERCQGSNAMKHAIDIAAARYDMGSPTEGGVSVGDQERFRPRQTSGAIKIIDCDAHYGRDDCFTTHGVDGLIIRGLYAWTPNVYNSNAGNSNPIEFDDNTKNVDAIGLIGIGGTSCLEIKGHESHPAARNLNIRGFYFESSHSSAIDIHHTGHTGAGLDTFAFASPSAFGITLDGGIIVNCVRSESDTADKGYITAASYVGLTIRNVDLYDDGYNGKRSGAGAAIRIANGPAFWLVENCNAYGFSNAAYAFEAYDDCDGGRFQNCNGYLSGKKGGIRTGSALYFTRIIDCTLIPPAVVAAGSAGIISTANPSAASIIVRGNKVAPGWTNKYNLGGATYDVDVDFCVHPQIGLNSPAATIDALTSQTGIFTQYATIGGVRVIGGAGAPEGVVAAPVGSRYFRSNGEMYKKATGTAATGWVQVTEPTWSTETGWTAGTGTPLKGAFNADPNLVLGASYDQAQVQAVRDHAIAAGRRALALENVLRSKGIIN